MFYKKNDDGSWLSGNNIHFPDGTVLSKDNKIEKDGWFWSDEPPQEYLDFVGEQEKDTIN